MKDPRDGDELDRAAHRILSMNVKERTATAAELHAGAIRLVRAAVQAVSGRPECEGSTRLAARLNLRIILTGHGPRA